MKLEVRFQAVPVEGMRAFLEPLGYRFDWGPELDGIGFHWFNQDWPSPLHRRPQEGLMTRRRRSVP